MPYPKDFNVDIPLSVEDIVPKDQLANVYRGSTRAVMISQREYQDLRSLAHNCFFHHSLLNGIPIISRDDLAYNEWAYKTTPERLEVSMEIWESLKALKSPFEWHEFEDALWSTQ